MKNLVIATILALSTASALCATPSPAEKKELLAAAKNSAFLFAVTSATIDSCPSIPPDQASQFAKILKNFEINTVTKILGTAAASQYREDFNANYSRMMTEFTKAKPSDVDFLCSQTQQQLPSILKELQTPSSRLP